MSEEIGNAGRVGRLRTKLGLGAESLGRRWRCVGVLASTVIATGWSTSAIACQSATVTSPTTQSVYAAPASFSIGAQVVAGTTVDGDGTVINKRVRSIRLFQDGVLHSTQTMNTAGTVAVNFPVASVAAGAHTYHVVGQCTVGSRTSATVTVHSNAAPTVSVTSPAPASSFVAPASVTLSAQASDVGGSVTRVEFRSGASLIGTATTAPYSVSWGGLGSGTYTVFARVVDNLNTVVDSSAVTFQVVSPPPIGISSPPNGAMLSAATGLTISGSASVPGSTVTRVDLYADGGLLGSVVPTGSAFSYLWASPSAGQHALTAVAVTPSGSSAPSAPVNVNVVSPTTIVPPNMASGGVAGTVLGTAAVASGRSSYSVAVHVPPGTKGFVPAVSLEYSSALGSGLLGTGWLIGGNSSITRCGSTKAHDGVTRGVNLNAQDQFCLDGQRLKLVSGVHGQNARYGTEIDTFAKVLSFGADSAKGPDRWEVWTKDGNVTHYGSTPDSLVEAQGRSPVVVLSWAQSRVQDRRGNYITYAYAKDSAEGAHWPTQISYTGTAGAVPYNAVRFEYDDRSDLDRTHGYVYGAKVSVTKRLRSVKSFINIASDGSGGTLVRDLRVGYVQSSSSGRSLVSTLSDCDSSGNCLPATSFGWSQRIASHNNFDAPGSGDWGGPAVPINWFIPTTASDQQRRDRIASEVTSKVIAGDFNGDGKQDLASSYPSGTWSVCLSTGTAFNCTSWPGPTVSSDNAMLGDFNGDGRIDVAHRPQAGFHGPRPWQICLSTGTGFDCGSWNMFDIPTSQEKFLVGDFSGDGRDDIVLGAAAYSQKLCISSGSAAAGFNCIDYAQVENAISVAYNVDLAEVPRSAAPTAADFDGDSRADILKVMYLGSGGATTSIWRATTTGFELVSTTGSTFSGSTAGHATNRMFPSSGGSFFSDHNLDLAESYPDSLVAYPHDSDPAQSGVRYCQYKGVSGTHCVGLNVSSTLVDDFRNDTFSDVDGDRRADGIHWNRARNQWRVCQLNMSGSSYTCSDWGNSANPDNYAARYFGDFNGDGKVDVALYNRDTGRWMVRLANGPSAELLLSVVEGNGLENQFTYKPLTDANVYTKDTGSLSSQLPVFDVQAPDLVVSQHRTANARGGWLITDYEYQGMKVDLDGRGSLGFRVEKATDGVSGIQTETTFLQAFPYAGMPSLQRILSMQGVELVRTQTQYAQKTSASGLVFPVVTSVTEQRRELDGSATTLASTVRDANTGYDSFGNVLAQTASVSADGSTFTTTVASSYDNNDASWLISQLRVQTVTRTAPSVPAVVRKSEQGYNAYGEVAYAIVEPDNPALRVTATIGASDRDSFGNVLAQRMSWIDPRTGSTVQRANETAAWELGRGRFKKTSQNALGHIERFEYNEAHGGLESYTSANLQVTLRSYDAWGRRTSESRPDGTSTTWSYRSCVDACADGTTALVMQHWRGTAQTSAPEESVSDALARQVRHKTWGFDGIEVRTDRIFNAAGRLEYTSRPYKVGANPVWAGYTYDDLSRVRVKSELDDLGVSRNTTINFAGLTETTTNPKNQSTSRRFNANQQIDRVTDAADKATTYLYDPFGNLKRITDPLGNQTNFSFDTLGRKVSMQDPDLGSWEYLVDPIGQKWRETDAEARETNFWHDALGRLVRRFATDQDARFVYDTAPNGLGRLASTYTLIAGGPAQDYTRVLRYDSLSRLSTQTTTLDQDYVEKYAYGLDGRLESVRHERNATGTSGGPGTTFSMGYNALGYLAEVRTARQDGHSSVSWAVQQQDAENRVTQARLGNGLVTRKTFGPNSGRLSHSFTGTSASDSSVQDDTYVYDSIGNLESRTQRSQGASFLTESMVHDPVLNLLRSSTVAGQATKSFEYDDARNIKTKSGVGTYVYPPSGPGSDLPHAPSSIVGVVNGFTNPQFDYDNNGNLTGGAGRALTWTSFNRPLTISAGGAVSTFTYGSSQQRVRQTISDASGPTTIIYAGAIEKETKGSVTTYRTSLPLGLGYVEEVNGVASTRYYHRDHLGSVHAITSDSGALVGERTSFDPWGKRRQPDGLDDPTNALRGGADHDGFTGHEHLEAQTLIHMSARVYDPITGRFLSPDPTIPSLYDVNELNRYAYVLNQPLSYVDPTGYAGTTLAKVVITGSPCGAVCQAWASQGWRTTTVGELNAGGGGSVQRVIRVIKVAGPQVLRVLVKRGVIPAAVAAVASRPVVAAGVAVVVVAGAVVYVIYSEVKADEGVAGESSSSGGREEEGKKKEELPKLDSTGKVHGSIPSHVPESATTEELRELAEDLPKSIETRKDEQNRLGEDGPHRERLRQEERLLRQIIKKLSGS